MNMMGRTIQKLLLADAELAPLALLLRGYIGTKVAPLTRIEQDLCQSK
jgi:hypothetical protein